jgi:transcriptional regulator with XRE-family HTH domain
LLPRRRPELAEGARSLCTCANHQNHGAQVQLKCYHFSCQTEKLADYATLLAANFRHKGRFRNLPEMPPAARFFRAVITDPDNPQGTTMPLDSAQIRHHNFIVLYRQFRQEHGHLPERGMLKMFAQRVGLSDRYLSHIKCNRKNIGNNVARAIEEALGLPRGWMDREHDRSTAPLDAGDDAEKMFLETAKLLYRAEPEAMRRVVMELLQRKLTASGFAQ